MSQIVMISHDEWGAVPAAEAVAAAVPALESGDLLRLSRLRFAVAPEEASLFTSAILGSSKNASFDPASGRLGGTTATGADAETLRRLMRRFSDAAASLVSQLLPPYRRQLTRGRASFRPAEIEGRVTSWRKDDTRLHIDSFPATPTGGRRILRVFTNVNPDGRPRTWRIGGDFDAAAVRFAGSLRLPLPGLGHLLALIRVTKTRRTAYDALMLQLHDLMKADQDFQTRSPQTKADFPSGSTWVAFTDQVSHAATAGQYQLEQTFLLPVDAMLDESRSPLRILERMIGKRLN